MMRQEQKKDAKLPAGYEEMKKDYDRLRGFFENGRVQDLNVNGGMVVCPNCGFICTHMTSIHTYKDPDIFLDSQRTRIISEDESLLHVHSGHTENGVAIRMSCEDCDATWTMKLVGHEGNVFFECNIDE